MQSVVFSTPLGPLRLQLFAREAPAACRHFAEQHAAGAWAAAKFYKADAAAVYFGAAHGAAPRVRDEEPARLRFDERGMVAYARSSTSELVFSRGAPAPAAAGPVFARVAPEGLHILETIARQPDEHGVLLCPVGLSAAASGAQPEAKRRRIKIQLREESDDDDLPARAARGRAGSCHSRQPAASAAAATAAAATTAAATTARVSDELRALLDFEQRLRGGLPTLPDTSANENAA